MATTAAIYTRISRDQTGQQLGITRQESECRDLAQRLDADVVEVFSDNDISAWSGKTRPGYDAMLGAIRDGRISLVIAWHQDRLTRTPRDLEDYADLAIAHRVKTHFVQQGEIDMSNHNGLLTARITGAVARHESDQKQARIKAQKRQAAQSGKWRGGRRPFGYESDGVTVRESEAHAVLKATREVLSGASINSIRKQWNADGLRTSQGTEWHTVNVKKVLSRARNAGLLIVDGAEVRAEWPAIVPEGEWRSLMALFARRSRPWRPQSLLGSGLYRCVCGQAMAAGQSGKDRIPTYRCSDNERPGPHVTRSREMVDEFVKGVITSRLQDVELAAMLAPDTSSRVADLEADAVQLRDRLDGLATLYANGAIDAQQLGEGSRELRAQLDTVHAQISASYDRSALSGIGDAPDPGEAFLRSPLARQREVIDALCTVVLLPAPKGRPAGWQPGEPYFWAESVRIDWKSR